MTIKNDGGPAFPKIDTETVCSQGEYQDRVYSYGGMTLRDYFAAKALGGWWSSPDSMCALPKGTTFQEFQSETCARFYEWADAMLAARSAS